MAIARARYAVLTAGVLALGAACLALPFARIHAESGATLTSATGAVAATMSAPVASVSGAAELPRMSVPAGMADKLAAFISALWPDAQKRGIPLALYERAFAGVTPDPDIFDLLANQPEHTSAPWDYMNRLASDARIEAGRRKLAEHAELLAKIEARYGVDKRIVLAVWGVESNFGAGPGTRHVVRSLATLAVGDPRRPEFWRTELLAALTILQRGDVTLERMTGSWAGAMGHTQFMPTTYLAHAADFDGDGRRDIWGSVGDALASTANYLKVSGWQAGEPWGMEVVLPAGFDFAHSRPGTTKALGQWSALGVSAPFGRPLPASSQSFALVMPAGSRGPVFLVSTNFKAILKYNASNAYALAVGHIADRIGGGDTLAGMWPVDDPPLGRHGRQELQRLLSAQGYDTGSADGILGNSSRAAIRGLQLKLGLPEDGYAGERLLMRIREMTGRRWGDQGYPRVSPN